jgi:hypothetical protein
MNSSYSNDGGDERQKKRAKCAHRQLTVVATVARGAAVTS